MAPLPLNAAKSKRTGFRTGVRRKIGKLKAICDPEVLELDKLSAASERLAEAWQKYKSSHQDGLGLVAEDEVFDEQVTFTEMEEAYEAATVEAKKIIKGERRADDVGRAPQPE